jgi:hypothetical protein
MPDGIYNVFHSLGAGVGVCMCWVLTGILKPSMARPLRGGHGRHNSIVDVLAPSKE